MKSNPFVFDVLMVSVAAMNVFVGHTTPLLKWGWRCLLVAFASMLVYDWLQWRRRR